MADPRRWPMDVVSSEPIVTVLNDLLARIHQVFRDMPGPDTLAMEGLALICASLGQEFPAGQNGVLYGQPRDVIVREVQLLTAIGLEVLHGEDRHLRALAEGIGLLDEALRWEVGA